MVVIDNFIRDRQLLEAIALSDEFSSAAGQWWEGWWKTPAVTLRQRLVQEIWGERCPLHDAPTITQQAAGFEHWVGKRSADSSGNRSLPPHRDRDESLYSQSGTTRHPVIGAVFYPLRRDFSGGYLQIFNEDSDDGPFELIEPRFNRLVIFDPSILHGVTDVTAGHRYALAVNVWDKPILCVADGTAAVNG